MDVGNQFVFVERFCYVVVGVEVEIVNFVFNVGYVGEDQDWCFYF